MHNSCTSVFPKNLGMGTARMNKPAGGGTDEAHLKLPGIVPSGHLAASVPAGGSTDEAHLKLPGIVPSGHLAASVPAGGGTDEAHLKLPGIVPSGHLAASVPVVVARTRRISSYLGSCPVAIRCTNEGQARHYWVTSVCLAHDTRGIPSHQYTHAS